MLASAYLGSLKDGRSAVLLLDMIREIEAWCNQNAVGIMRTVPEQQTLDNMRSDWINGVALSSIKENEDKADDIVKDYYGFTLPWIIHAISQMFDKETEEEIVEIYEQIAMYIELGVPDLAAANIYMAGIRSRSVAVELSDLQIFNDKSVSGIKQILLSSSLDDEYLSESAEAWIELLSETSQLSKPMRMSFPDFEWKRTGLPPKLYLREHNNELFMISFDGYFCEKVNSTDDLPFADIANIMELYFELKGDTWELKSYNPHILIE